MSGKTMTGVDADQLATLPAARIGGFDSRQLGPRNFGGRPTTLRILSLTRLNGIVQDFEDLNDIVQDFEDLRTRSCRTLQGN